MRKRQRHEESKDELALVLLCRARRQDWESRPPKFLMILYLKTSSELFSS